MELLVHGTKQGYKSSFIPNSQPTFSLGDIRNGVNNENPLGKSAYSIAFFNGGIVYTKYTIIRDTLRAYATGNIAFSLFLPANRELGGKGADVKSLLDKLSKFYIEEYVRDNNVNRGETTLIHEDWSFLQDITTEYTEQEKNRKDEEIASGTDDPAFHYYKSDIDLIELLDKPYQEEYSRYRQILFIDSNLQGASNPLNVLKNSGIELNPDLKNEYYYLNNYNSHKGIKITANNQARSDKKGENKIRAKWHIEINYSKDDRSFRPINAKGTISDPSSEIHKYIEIKGNQIMLKYDAFDNPIKKEKKVTFEIKDHYGINIEGAEIQIDNLKWYKVDGSSITKVFCGEDIIKPFKISARKESENLYSEVVTFMPDTQNEPVLLNLQKQKKVKIFVIDNENGNYIPNFKFWCNDGKGYRENISEMIFVNDEIGKTWIIKVSKIEGQVNYLGKIEYCPAEKNDIIVHCHKSIKGNSPNVAYKIDPGEHGKKAEKCPEYSNSSTGDDLDKNIIVPNPGYVFKNWELVDGIHVAKYEKKIPIFKKAITILKSPAGIVSAIVSVLVIFGSIWAINKLPDKNNLFVESQISLKQINDYVEGNSLFLDTLNNIKDKWEAQKKSYITEYGGGCFGGEKNVNDSKVIEIWQPVKNTIDSAITKRVLINSKDFSALKKLHYSNTQHSFKSAIEKIESTKYEDVARQLGITSQLTLTQIAEKINEILNIKSSIIESPSTTSENTERKPAKQNEKSGKDEGLKTKTSPPKANVDESTQQTDGKDDMTSEIIHYIKGSELDEEKLEEYSKTRGIKEDLKTLPILCFDFWELGNSTDTKKPKTYYSFRDKINADKNFENSKLDRKST
ncbi:MAG TPA: hypothetical protein DCQ58_06730, partial [Saprospirales bacterium]|nr:hypothetical protein [Saprospirales bacterium]